VDHHFERVADLELFGLDGQGKLAEGKRAFGFAADIDEQFVLVLRDDDAGEHLAFIENFQALFVQALLESELIFFFGFDCRRWRSDSASN
jgi:hypothetical protein